MPLIQPGQVLLALLDSPYLLTFFNRNTRMDYNIIQGLSLESNKFIKSHHYLKSVSRGNKFVFNLMLHGRLVGVAAFGICTGTKAQLKYGKGKPTLELKRFVLLPGLVKNTASWFLSRCCATLFNNYSIQVIITYADPRQGHTGAIYKASNFTCLGQQRYPTMALLYKGRLYTSRIVYQKTKIGKKLRTAVKKSKAKFITLPRKYVFILYK